MSATLDGRLVVAISSRALFDLERLDIPAKPGVAFSLVQKLLAFNPVAALEPPNTSAAEQAVEVVILSRNDPVSGMRVFRSARHYALNIERGSFTRGQSPWRYLKPLHANLFLSTHLSDVRAALAAGAAAGAAGRGAGSDAAGAVDVTTAAISAVSTIVDRMASERNRGMPTS